MDMRRMSWRTEGEGGGARGAPCFVKEDGVVGNDESVKGSVRDVLSCVYALSCASLLSDTPAQQGNLSTPSFHSLARPADGTDPASPTRMPPPAALRRNTSLALHRYRCFHLVRGREAEDRQPKLSRRDAMKGTRGSPAAGVGVVALAATLRDAAALVRRPSGPSVAVVVACTVAAGAGRKGRSRWLDRPLHGHLRWPASSFWRAGGC